MTTTDALADVIALAVHTATAPLLAKIAALEARPYVTQDFLDVLKDQAADVRARLMTVEARAAVPGPPGEPGKDGAPGKDGRDGRDGTNGLNGIDGAIGPAGKDGKDGINGKDGSPGLAGKDGKDGRAGLDGKDGAPGRDGKDGKDGLHGTDGAPGLNGKDGADGLHGTDGAPGRDGTDGAPGASGKDGVGLADAVIDQHGALLLTFTDGRTKTVGVVVGKDGAMGRHGTDGAPGRDGVDGKDGAPGLSPEDFDWTFDPDTRAFTIKFFRADRVLVERTKILTGMRIYRGVFEASKTYECGDVVTWSGSEWTAMAQTTDRPGNGATAWKLSVKHGDQGKPGPEGKPGRDGKDLTQMDTKGRKW